MQFFSEIYFYKKLLNFSQFLCTQVFPCVILNNDLHWWTTRSFSHFFSWWFYQKCFPTRVLHLYTRYPPSVVIRGTRKMLFLRMDVYLYALRSLPRRSNWNNKWFNISILLRFGSQINNAETQFIFLIFFTYYLLHTFDSFFKH